jgi:hypothetical protein
MNWDDVIDMPPWGDDLLWKQANEAIVHLIHRHRFKLAQALTKAYEIRDMLLDVFPIQDELLAETCISCQFPCCVTATVWLDFCDLLFIHLTGQAIPERQLLKQRPESCRYHSDKGCVLPRLSRPWVCTLYFCPPQMAALRRRGDMVRESVHEKIASIKTARKELEELFIKITS